MLEVKKILRKAEDSVEISPDEALILLKITGKDFTALQQTADQLCFEKKNNLVSFVINRNINFTNVCYQGCKFFRRIEMFADQPGFDAIIPLRQFYFRVTDRNEVAVFCFK